jgi:hypothetical protein
MRQINFDDIGYKIPLVIEHKQRALHNLALLPRLDSRLRNSPALWGRVSRFMLKEGACCRFVSDVGVKGD